VIRLDIDHLPSGPRSQLDFTICPAEPPRSQSGCGGRARTPPQRTQTGSGRHTCVVSTSSTPSACSSRPSAGPVRRSAPPRRRTAGRG